MIVKTKKYKMPTSTYVRLGLQNVLREQWWVLLIALTVASGTFFMHTLWFVLGASIGLLLYFVFWLIQFYGITYVAENQVLFSPLRYEISSQQLIMQVTPKQGMPIVWNQIKRAVRKRDAFLLVISKAHLIYLPHKVFNSKHEIKFVETILKRKALI